MDRLEEIYSSPADRVHIEAWKEVFNEDLPGSEEVREMLLYRTFIFFSEKLQEENQGMQERHTPPEVVRLFAEHFSWVKEEVSLIRQHGINKVDRVFQYAFGEPEIEEQAPVNIQRYRTRFFTLSIIWLLLISSLLVYLLNELIQRGSIESSLSSSPYYPCSILFFDSGKENDLSTCTTMANTGDEVAQTLLGLAYLYASELQKQPDQAIEWLTKAANQSNPKAMLLLGAILAEDIREGDEVLRGADFQAASYWLEKAAAAGEFQANTYLACLYILRERGQDEYRLARERLILAANAEQADAFLGMAYFELFGLLSHVEYETARNWLDLYARTVVPDGSNEAAWLLATSNDPGFRDAEQAEEYIGLLLREPDHENLFMYLDTVAAVHAVNGNFEDAVDFQEQAINLLGKQDRQVYRDNIDDFQQRLTLFRENRTWTEALPDDYVKQRFTGIKNRIFYRELTSIVTRRKPDSSVNLN